MAHSILIVDDEAGIRQSLGGVLEDEGFTVTTVESGEACLQAFEKRLFTCVLLDVWLPGIDGLETLERLKANYPDVSVVMISGHGRIETAVRATKLGAYDFIEKPLSLEKTVLAVKNAIRRRELEAANSELQAKLERTYVMIGDSVPMRALRQQIAYAAPTSGRVLLYGESGTGKELVARALHSQSARAARPFIEVNCAAIPEDLIESELFGHVKGAFTGATQAKRGKFERADGGTLFLDEVADMSLKTQSKVLRVLEEQRFESLGSENSLTVDVRVIAATNKRIEAEIERGLFRADLFYRLNVIPFEIPPLRERLEDIPLLTQHFNLEFSLANRRPPKEFKPSAIERMQNYAWPGNVRELRNTVERVIIMNLRNEIEADELPILSGEAPPASSYNFDSYREASETYEREYIQRKLAETDGNISRTAELMGIDRSHLYRRMKALGINRS
ncbi:MAG TPA: sigma-54 dependent transcriptional regulator [Blastocatellia bacterium]|nr:sigma-54 dependent transcriptional regulator [Blastocatellia bacterium]HMV87894.1 sigma-54 dependent transcriptional regulator [Blastocatellia bacterium]HMX26557.1 sigma-54 dependent transcriptional regulator [Blastocatellia bacterium]HMY73863.1 sigma-54 dependent transcriptional regulator [Blastocatellia bacterium]HMZ20526.1 sigma-54 dependent transcriptional regulator [Blastocatellia bacterium]